MNVMWDPYEELRYAQLPNGLSVCVGTWDRPWVKVSFVVHSGAKDDPIGKEGLAHFVEHMVSKNLAGYSQREAKEFFDNCGGYVEFGETSNFATIYRFCVPLDKNNLANALKIFGRLLITCDIKKHLDEERAVIVNEYKRKIPIKTRLS